MGGHPGVRTTCASGTQDKNKVSIDVKILGERLSGVGGWRRRGQATKQFVRGQGGGVNRV